MSKDANDILQAWQQAGLDNEAQAAAVARLLETAEPAIMVQARAAGDLAGAAKVAAVEELTAMAARLRPFDAAFYERKIAKLLGIGVQQWRAMVKVQGTSAAAEEEGEGEPIYTTGGWVQGHLLELLYDPERLTTRLAVRYPDGRVEAGKDGRGLEKVVIEGRVYRPILPNSIITKKIVRLPSQVGPLLAETELLERIRRHITKYFDFGADRFFEALAPMYVLFSYFYDGFRELSYLRALGDYGTGKTRFLKTVGYLCYRPIYMSGGSSAASIFRLLDIYRGTLVLNEGDFGTSDEASIIAKILNGGTERDESITRVKKTSSGELDIEAFNVFGPKVIATRKEFDDRAIASRCLTMEMTPSTPHPRIPRSLPAEFEAEALAIRNLMTRYRLENAREDFEVDESLGDRAIESRLNQVTLSLMTIIKEQAMREKIRAFLRDYNERTRAERYETKTARVLEGLIRAWAWGPVSEHPSDENRVYLKDITFAANQIMTEQRMKMGDIDEEDLENLKKMTSKSVSNVLKKYLQLRATRATDGPSAYKGTYAIDMGAEMARVKALCERWGVQWVERGALKRNTGTPIEPKKPAPRQVEFRDI